MTLVTAVQTLFSKIVPVDADFERAFNVLKGKKDTDLSQTDVTKLDELAEFFQDFVSDPDGWLKKVSGLDPRYSQWVKLAQALGASVTSGPGTATATTSADTLGLTASDAPVDLIAHEIEPEQGIDPDALAGGVPASNRRSGGGNGGGGIVVVSDDTDDRDDQYAGRERRPPEPPPRSKPIIDVTDRNIPEIIKTILAYGSYRTWSSWLLSAFCIIRRGTTVEQAHQRTELVHMRALIESMKVSGDRMEIQMGFHLEHLLEHIEAGRDLSDPDWFKANYVSDSYAD